LKKPSEKRSKTDIKLLVECTKHIKFFIDITLENGQQTHEKCCKYMRYESFSQDSIVFEIGSEGFEFYIIMKGSIAVLVKIPRICEEINEKGEKIQRIEEVLTEVRTLGIGASFGELALIDNKPRAATIKCRENCDFAVFDKKHFNNILSFLLYFNEFTEEISNLLIK